MLGLALPTWLTAKVAGYLGGALLIVVVLGALYGSGRHAGRLAEARKWQGVITTYKTALGDWQRATQLWGQAVSMQNQAIERLKSEQARKAHEAERQIAEANKSRKRAEERIARHQHAELKGTTLEQWEQADRLVVEGLKP